MAGISSKAIAFGSNENKKKYQQYEFISDFNINLYESFYRTHDPQLGRFWQIDPRPTHFESLYVAMGNNPIRNFDILGDILIGVNQASGQRTLDLIQGVLGKIKGAENASKLFKLESDGVIFSGFSKKDLRAAIKGLGSDASALIRGYSKLVNNASITYFSAIVDSKKGEKVDLSNAQGLNSVFNKWQGYDISKEGGHSQISVRTAGQGLVMVDLNPEIELKGISNNKWGPFVPDAGFIFSHEALGHMLSIEANTDKIPYGKRELRGDVDAIRVNNLFFRATESHLHDNGAGHSQDGRFMKENVNQIPDYLKGIIL